MKICKVCHQAKFYDPTAKQNSIASGFMGLVCTACRRVQSKQYAQVHRATPEGALQAKLANNKAKQKAMATAEGRAYYSKASLEWCKRYPERSNALSARKRAAKLQRTPPWADAKAIQEVYAQASAQGLVVDHVYPLQGKLVSGLHVHTNLQLLTAVENGRKYNSMPTDM